MKLLSVFTWCILFSVSYKAAGQNNDETYAKGLEQYFAGAYKLAAQTFTESIRKNPNQPEAYLYRGNCLAFLHDFKDAKKDYDIAAKSLKNSAELNFGFGYLCNEEGEYTKAISYLDKAVEINPKHALAYNTRGVSYQSLGKPRVAIENYTEAIRLDSTLAIAYNNRGTAIYENQDIAKATNLDIRTAIKDLDRAINIDPTLCVAWRNRGMAYNFLNNYDKALSDLNAAINCNGKSAVYYINRGEVLIKRGLDYGAIEDFKMALGLDPKQAEAEIFMGVAYDKTADIDKAIAHENNAIAIDKRYEGMADYEIATFYANTSNKIEMLKYLKLAKKKQYFKSKDNLDDFHRAPEFSSYKSDADFIVFKQSLLAK